MIRNFMITIASLGLLILAGCGDSEEVTTITGAVAADSGTAAELTGFIVQVGDEAQLCEALAESFPPQCGGGSIPVEGLDLAALDTETEGDVTWTNDQVTLTGTIEDGLLEVDD